MDGRTGGALPLPLTDYAHAFHDSPVALLVIRAVDLVMVDANAPYLAAVGKSRDEVVGRHVFDVFPADDTNPDAFDLAAYFELTIASAAPQIADGIRYDIPSAGGGTETRWWNVIETPLLDDDGRVHQLLHYTEDVTALVRARAELAQTEAARELAARQLAGLAEVALALSSAATVAEVEQIVFDRGLTALAVDGGGLITRDGGGNWQLTTSDMASGQIVPAHGTLPYFDDAPAASVARTGEPVLLPTVASGLAYGSRMSALYDDTGRNGWAFLPMAVSGEVLGCLAIAWNDEHHVGAAELEVLEGFAAQCASALHRIWTAEEEHRTAAQLAEMAEALQRALLTPPPPAEGLQIAVRYRSAVDATRVGGDWYDAFAQRDGGLMFVIGDVVGHDSAAAAVMGQLRSVLRVVGHTVDTGSALDTPAGILGEFERVAADLGVDSLATGVLVRVEQDAGGERMLRWSNAGHPPPILLQPDGTTTVLDEKPNLLLGMGEDTVRTDHTVPFADGATLLLYTDGLIERRSSGLDEGIDDLRAAMAELAGHSVEELSDLVLERLAPHIGEDDIAMLVVRAVRT